MIGRPLTARQIGEYWSRDFHGEETWKRWKTDYDWCMAYRKTLKGRPTEEQRAQLEHNAEMVEWYGFVLFHSPQLAAHGRCDCARCGTKRTAATTPAAPPPPEEPPFPAGAHVYEPEPPPLWARLRLAWKVLRWRGERVTFVTSQAGPL